MKFSISFKYSNVTFKNKETKETISYDTKAEGNTFTFDNIDEDVVIGMVKGIKEKKASQLFAYDDLRTNFINTMARNKCKELYDKLDKGGWKIGDVAISNITIKDVEFTKPTMNARETITVESRKRIAESYWMTDYKWSQPYEVVFTDGSTFTVPGKTESPINFYRYYNNDSYEDIMRKTYGSGLELGKEIDHFNMPSGNVITMDDIQDELDFYYDELNAKLSFNETSREVKSSKRKRMLEELIVASKDNDNMWADLIDIYEKYFGEYKIERPFKYGYASESIDGEYDDEDDGVGDGQWHVFDYGPDFPLVEQYMIMAPTGDTFPATSRGAICDYDGEYYYSTRQEMEDDVFALEVDGEEWIPTEIDQPYPREVQKAIRLVISRLEESGTTVEEP